MNKAIEHVLTESKKLKHLLTPEGSELRNELRWVSKKELEYMVLFLLAQVSQLAQGGNKDEKVDGGSKLSLVDGVRPEQRHNSVQPVADSESLKQSDA
jgi:hypothetical protein